MTNFFELVIFLPLYMLERRKFKLKIQNNLSENLLLFETQLSGWKKNKKLLLLIGIIFTAVPVLNFFGLEHAGTINGSMVLKSRILFSLVFGYLILQEKVSIVQVIFSFILLFGLALAITQGSFNLLEFNIGVLILFINVVISPLGHNLTKSRLDKKEITPYQIIVVRNIVSILILFSTYFLIFPMENIQLLLTPTNYIWFVIMGFNYGFGLLFWYKTISYLEMGKAMILMSFTTVVSTFFATLFLGEAFTYFHLIGIAIMIISTIIIIREEKV